MSLSSTTKNSPKPIFCKILVHIRSMLCMLIAAFGVPVFGGSMGRGG